LGIREKGILEFDATDPTMVTPHTLAIQHRSTCQKIGGSSVLATEYIYIYIYIIYRERERESHSTAHTIATQHRHTCEKISGTSLRAGEHTS